VTKANAIATTAAANAPIAIHSAGEDLDLVVAWCAPAEGVDVLDVATPREPERRGCQLSLRVKGPREAGRSLYDHLHANPSFSAGIDAWWEEPRDDEPFRPRRPFLELPNVIGSPHNSAITAGTWAEAARRAASNVARHLRGEPVEHLVNRADYVEST
jgi:hypothetical protein